MSGRRSKLIHERKIEALILHLQSLSSAEADQSKGSKVSLVQLLEETCNHIKKLHREADELSRKLAELMASSETELKVLTYPPMFFVPRE